jgi:hypothetical protein
MFAITEVYGRRVATLRYFWPAVKYIVDVDPDEASAKSASADNRDDYRGPGIRRLLLRRDCASFP